MYKRKHDELEDNDYSLPEHISNSEDQVSMMSEDEEDDGDDNEEAYILKKEDIEAQEEGAVGIEGGIQVTPFNMKEEMEEGHFDAQGMYHWNKDDKLARDSWMDNIDWIKVKETSKDAEDTNSSDELPSPPDFDIVQAHQNMLLLMKPKETVYKALRRLGSNNLSTAERWKRKKAGQHPTEEEEKAQKDLAKLTELADGIFRSTNNVNIYQETYEVIKKKVDEVKARSSKGIALLDMYSDDFDEKEKERLGGDGSTSADNTEEGSVSLPPVPDVMWDLKWHKDSTDITGPYTSDQMHAWSQTGYFKEEVWVRKHGMESDFHSSKRIDFELYLQ